MTLFETKLLVRKMALYKIIPIYVPHLDMKNQIK